MEKNCIRILSIIFFVSLLPVLSFGIDSKDTRMLSQPAISQNHIAFIYAEDLWIANLDGSYPKRLTWHPGNDLVRGFTPDGKSVLFASQRSTFSGRYFQLFTVSLDGGFPVKLDIPNGWFAAYSPDGKQLAYSPLVPVYQQWKHYRGGTISRIWLYTFADHSVATIPQPKGGCNDADPM
jgi:tricorn protease